MSGKVIVRETSCRPMEIIDESGHAVVRETSVRESDCPGKTSVTHWKHVSGIVDTAVEN